MSKWIYNNPVYECDELNHDILFYSPWAGHRDFAYDYLQFFKSSLIVELGTHYGCSYFTFAQAIKDFKMESVLYGIDTWEGDDYTKNDYHDDVFHTFKETLDKYYDVERCLYLRTNFDNALKEFADASIDLLHIDGSHNYDDVRHDFESWLPKVKKDGVIFLHDISEDIVLGKIMGSHYYWQELKRQFSYYTEFDFSWGLGIIFLSQEKYEQFKKVFDPWKYQRKNNIFTETCKDRLRELHFVLIGKEEQIGGLYFQIENINQQLAAAWEMQNRLRQSLESNMEHSKEVESRNAELSNIIKALREETEGLQRQIIDLNVELQHEKNEKNKAFRTIEYLNADIHYKQLYIEKLEKKR